MSLRMEEGQKFTDAQRHLADQREALHRFAPLAEIVSEPQFDAMGNQVSSIAHFKISAPSPVDDWDGWLARREQIEREEKKAFNDKFGYAQ